MNTHSTQRQPHAVLDLPSRGRKALKIARLLDLADRPQPMRLLEIGTGSGGIAHWFAMQPELRCEVSAVDICDNRQVHDGYAFQLVQGVELPFDDASFDVVISNHVIEHVGDAQAQARHLAEIRRVMKPGGMGYLAVPNRWMLVEPHFRLPFLSWLPLPLSHAYVRAAGKGSHYDCRPLTRGSLERLLTRSQMYFEHLCVPALRLAFEIERPRTLAARALRRLPDRLIATGAALIPTLIYRLTR